MYIKEALRLYHLNALDRNDIYGIVKLHNTFYHRSQFCLVMELLEASLDRHNTFTLMEIQEIGYQLLSAVHFLHKNHYIHTDLKPENILFTRDKRNKQRIKLIDFGNVIKEDEINFYSDENHYELQSLQYRAPEVSLSKHTH
jgi:serine/threonine protein kinase